MESERERGGGGRESVCVCVCTSARIGKTSLYRFFYNQKSGQVLISIRR